MKVLSNPFDYIKQDRENPRREAEKAEKVRLEHELSEQQRQRAMAHLDSMVQPVLESLRDVAYPGTWVTGHGPRWYIQRDVSFYPYDDASSPPVVTVEIEFHKEGTPKRLVRKVRNSKAAAKPTAESLIATLRKVHLPNS